MNADLKEAISVCSRRFLERKGYEVVAERPGDSIACLFGDIKIVVDISSRTGTLPPEVPMKASRAQELSAWAAKEAFALGEDDTVRLDSLTFATDVGKSGSKCFVRHITNMGVEPDDDYSSMKQSLDDYVLSSMARLVGSNCAEYASSALKKRGYEALLQRENFIFSRKGNSYVLFEALDADSLRNGEPMVSRPRLERAALDVLADMADIPDTMIDFGLVVVDEDGRLKDFRTGILLRDESALCTD